MNKGDIVTIARSGYAGAETFRMAWNDKRYGIILGIQKYAQNTWSSVDVLWCNGSKTSIMSKYLEVVFESG